MLRALAAVLALAVPLAGCGNERTRVPDVEHADPPAGTRVLEFGAAGVTLRAPQNWPNLETFAAPLLGGARSGSAHIAVWRYPRTETLPVTPTALEEVEELLVDRVERRDPTFELKSSAVRRRAGAPAIELLGEQTMNGRRRAVRSSHVFKHGAEVVVDAYARLDDFERLDRTVFLPALESLRITRP